MAAYFKRIWDTDIPPETPRENEPDKHFIDNANPKPLLVGNHSAHILPAAADWFTLAAFLRVPVESINKKSRRAHHAPACLE
jgi:hypothetical protein